jgi:hypothetical protein
MKSMKNSCICFLFFLSLTLSAQTDSLKVKDSLQVEKQIKEVIVVGQNKLIEQKGDRIIFNVKNSPLSTGVGANEILKNMPRIDPTSETLKIIGKSNVLVMVDDRLVNFSGKDLDNFLKTLRSEDISRIELITNPPAKYDAAGNSGLINIVLKKKTNIGFDGSVTGTYVQRTKPGFMPSANLNYSTEKLSIGLNIFAAKDIRTADSDIDIVYSDLTRKSKTHREDNTKSLSNGLSVDYSFKKSNLGMLINTDFWKYNQITKSKVRFVNNSGKIDSTQNLPSTNENKYNYLSFSPYYDLKLDTLGKKLKLNYNYLTRTNNSYSDFISENYSENFEHFNSQTSVKNNSESNYNVHTFNADLELPFTNFKIETGAKYSYFKNDSDIKLYDTTNGNPVLDNNQSNKFIYYENIYAGYFSIEKQWNDKFFTKAGLRYEATKTKGNSVTTNAIFENKFDYFFPSVYFSYNPNENNSFSLGYNKRIDRPLFYDVNPFRTYIDFYNYTEGNPKLEPSITHNIEFSYILKNNFSLTAYFSLLKNASDYITISQSDNPVIFSTPENFYKQKSYGLDLSYNWKITNNFSSYNSLSAYHNDAVSEIPEMTAKNFKGYGFFFSSRNNYVINSKLGNKLYLNYIHKFPSTDGFWKIYTRTTLSVGGIFNFLDKKLVLNVSISDVFRQFATKAKQQYPNLTWNSTIYNDQRNFNLSLTYKFGNNKSKTADRQIDDSDKTRLSK